MRKSLVIVSTALPPSASGQAKALERLLQGRTDFRYWFLSDNATTFTQEPGGGLGHYLRTGAPQPGAVRRMLGLNGQPSGQATLMKAVNYRAGEIESLMRGVPVAAVIGCSGNPFDLGGAALAARRMNAPFIAYLFDDPVYQWPEGRYRRLARNLEPKWAKSASEIICPNEVLAADVAARTGRAPLIVRNPVRDDVRFPVGAASLQATPPGPVRIVYTGSVYHAQGDAFAGLVAAMAQTPGRYRLHVYTSQPLEMLEANGLSGPDVERHPHVDDAEVTQVQRGADILFLPLAFRSSIHDVLLSSSPGKTGEYLLSGRPVLVHAPAGSFVSTYFRRTGAGLVVDEPSVSDLARALERLTSDNDLRARLVAAASEAGRDFSLATARGAFWGAIDKLVSAQA